MRAEKRSDFDWFRPEVTEVEISWKTRTVKQMRNRVDVRSALRAGGRLSTAGPVTVRLEMVAVAGAKLAGDRLVMARQIGKGLVDGRRRAVEKRIYVISDSAVHVGSVDTLLRFRIDARRDDTVDEIRLNITSESCLE